MKTRVLVTVKTYPTLSRKYGELVCTAGFREDGSWIRIYPIPFRKLDYEKKFKKWQWIEVELQRNAKRDHRPESHHILRQDSIMPMEDIPADGAFWDHRRRFALRRVHTNMARLIAEAHDRSKVTSLATFRPSGVIDAFCRPDSAEWSPTLLAQFRQTDLFHEIGDPFVSLEKIPWRFYLHFRDDQGKESRLMIEDWEICQLYRTCVQRGDSSDVAAEKVRQKILSLARDNDLHLFLGTTLRHHFRSLNPFIIIGLFYPKRPQLDLFSRQPQVDLFREE